MTENDPGAATEPDRTEPESAGEERDVREYLLRVALLVLGLVAIVALFQFYTSLLAVINQWIAREYRAIFRAAFNLVVLMAAGIGISLVVRELTRE